ncbi:MAG: hypothetical protein E7411_01195 [Ruminococcaceae bacterium]|nr:hypothetical protein [Oscillospiraceae bacterium]
MNEKEKNKLPEEMDFKVSAMCDCTGLVAEGMGTEEELLRYNEMYKFIQEPIASEEERKS